MKVRTQVTRYSSKSDPEAIKMRNMKRRFLRAHWDRLIGEVNAELQRGIYK